MSSLRGKYVVFTFYVEFGIILKLP